jgi:hypothetical protein
VYPLLLLLLSHADYSCCFHVGGNNARTFDFHSPRQRDLDSMGTLLEVPLLLSSFLLLPWW